MRPGSLLVVLAACSSSNAHHDDAATTHGDGKVVDTPMADVPGGVGEPAELAGITLFHNQVRAMVQTSPPLDSLVWDPNLAAYAKAWVMMCNDVEQPIGLVDHDPNRTDVAGYAYIGENIYGAGGGASAQQAVDLWASEKANYDYAANTCNGVCGHYTQLVWRDTHAVGCALYNCPGLQFGATIVCDYGPGGNVGGQRPY